MQGTVPGARRRGRPRTAWMDNIKTWTGLPVEESIRMTEDRDNGESTSMVWPTLASRTATEQKRTGCALCFMSDIVLLIDWLHCIDLFSCIAASVFNKLTYCRSREDAGSVSWRESEVRTTAQRLDDIGAASASCSGAPSDTSARLGTEAEVGSSAGVVARYRPYKCSACGRRSNWRWDLKKHVESTHAGTPALIIRLRDDVARATYDDVLAAQGGRTGVRLQRRPRDADRRLPADHTGRRLPVSPSVCLSVCVCVCVCGRYTSGRRACAETRQGVNVDECGKYVCLYVYVSVCLSVC